MKEKITNIIRTFQAVGPILGNALKSGQLINPRAELTESDPDILCENGQSVFVRSIFLLARFVFERFFRIAMFVSPVQ
jgi:hypothetical protein